MAFSAAVLWGVSGTCAQFLFQHRIINTEWLVTARLLLAGMLLLGFAQTQSGKSDTAPPITSIWRNRGDLVGLLLFSVFGMLAVQYTYFAAIRASNAATATILQYLGPTLIALYLAARHKKFPTRFEFIALGLALLGTILLVTHGKPGTLSLSPPALIWGLVSAVALAFYTLQPVALLKRHNTAVIIGWAMLIGGASFSFIHPPWQIAGRWDWATVVLFSFIIVFGSLVPFYLFLSSVKILGAANSSLLACTEPLSAALIGVLWLKIPFGVFDWLGTVCILATVALLAVQEKRPKPTVSG